MNSSAIVGNGTFQGKISLADDDAIVALVDELPYPSDECTGVGMVFGVDRQVAMIRPSGRIPIRIDGVVAKGSVFQQVSDRIHAATADAPVEPEFQHTEHRCFDIR